MGLGYVPGYMASNTTGDTFDFLIGLLCHCQMCGMQNVSW